LYHRRIVHLCNVKEVSPSKRLILKLLIYLFYLFVSWFITFGSRALDSRVSLFQTGHRGIFSITFFFCNISEAKKTHLRHNCDDPWI